MGRGVCNSQRKTPKEETCKTRMVSQIVAFPEYNSSKALPFINHSTSQSEPDHALFIYNDSSVRGDVVYTYPSIMHSLRWSPTVKEISSEKTSRTDLFHKPSYKCNCKNCKVSNCPSRVSSSSTIKPCAFKDNIMTFSDRGTMTPKLADMCCGVLTPIPTASQTSDVCLPPEVVVRENGTCEKLPPILKKSLDNNSQGCSGGIRLEAVRDTDYEAECCDHQNRKSRKSLFKKNKTPHENVESGRRVLYNEGIEDISATNYRRARSPTRSPVTRNLNRNTCAVTIRSRDTVDNEDIPHNHRNESKYHHNCKRGFEGPFIFDTEDPKYMIDNNVPVDKGYTKMPVKHYRHPNIVYPRKVLTSAMDIETFVARKHVQSPSAANKKTRKFKLF